MWLMSVVFVHHQLPGQDLPKNSEKEMIKKEIKKIKTVGITIFSVTGMQRVQGGKSIEIQNQILFSELFYLILGRNMNQYTEFDNIL